MQSFSQNQISRFKREAKKVSKNTDSTHLMVLDEKARSLGYANWNSLQNHQNSSTRIFPTFQRSPEEMQSLFKKVKKTTDIYIEEKTVRELIEPIHDKFANALSALIYAREYMKCILQVTRWSIDGLSIAYSEMRIFLPYSLQRASTGKYVITGRDYKPVGMTANKWVNYEDFPNLELNLSENDISQINNDGYLYTDGDTPWTNRKNAKKYLLRLEALISLVMRNQSTNKAFPTD